VLPSHRLDELERFVAHGLISNCVDGAPYQGVGACLVDLADNVPEAGPPLNVLQPKQMLETRRPVSPSVLYCMWASFWR
jgi:hypothetical protein